MALALPNHGHSDGGHDGAFGPQANALDVAVAIEALAPDAAAVVGMSLGGLTTIALAGHRPVVLEEQVGVLLAVLADVAEFLEIVDLVMAGHGFLAGPKKGSGPFSRKSTGLSTSARKWT